MTWLLTRGLIEDVELTRSQRRALLAMCCEVARADGSVHALEYERLLELLGQLSQGAVGFSELERWISSGPPAMELRLPEEIVKTFLREAVSIARADGKVDDAELATMKDLVQRYFDITHVA